MMKFEPGTASTLTGVAAACCRLMAFDAVNSDATSTSALSMPPGHSRTMVANNYMAAINAALWHVAARNGLALVDFDAVTQQVPHAFCVSLAVPLCSLFWCSPWT